MTRHIPQNIKYLTRLAKKHQTAKHDVNKKCKCGNLGHARVCRFCGKKYRQTWCTVHRKMKAKQRTESLSLLINK